MSSDDPVLACLACLASDVEGHDAVVAAIVDHLAADDAAVATLPGLARLSVRSYRGNEGRNPVTGTIVPVPPKRLPFCLQLAPWPLGKDPDEARESGPEGVVRELEAPEALAALAADIDARLREGGPRCAVHVGGLGTFTASPNGHLRILGFAPATPLRMRMNKTPLEPMATTALDAALAHLRGADFAVRDLQEMLAACRSAREPEDDVLVDLPAGLPKLLRAALARSAELGNEDRFGFLVPMRREWAWRDFAGDRASSPPDVFLLSDAPPRGRSEERDRVWALRLSDLGEADPVVTWCADHATLATSPYRARLSTWVQLFALETALGPLDRAQAGRVRAAVLRACPEVGEAGFHFPQRFAFALPDPWLQQVVLTW